jgi:GntR family transcriptional regulator
MDFNLTSKVPIFEQVKNQLKKYIEIGIYAPNDKLPSLRELASSLNVNPNTIERAFSELEKDGYIYSLNKKGFYVSESFQTQSKKEILTSIQNEILLAKKANISYKEINSIINSIYQEDKSND